MKNKLNVSEKKQMLYGTILSYVNLFFSVLISIFFTNYLVSKLGVNEYGIRSFALSFASYLSFFELGISTAYLRIVFKSRIEHGDEGVAQVNGLFLKIYSLLGFIALIAGVVIVSLIQFDIITFENLTQDFANAKFVISAIVAISFMNAAISFPCSVFSLIVSSCKKFIWRNLRILLITIFNFAVELVLLLLGNKSVGITLGCFVVEVIFNAINYLYVKLILKTRFSLKKNASDTIILKEIIIFSFFSFLASITQTLNLSVDKMLLGFISTSAVVSLYTLSVTFNGYVSTFYGAIATVFAPKITEKAVEGDLQSVQRSHDFVMSVTSIIITFIVFGFFCCGKEFVAFWLRNVSDLEQDNLFTIFLCASILLACNLFAFPQTTWLNIHRAFNKHKASSFIFVLAFVINIAISIVLAYVLSAYNLEIFGCVIGTIISYIVQTVFMAIYTKKHIGININKYGIEMCKNILFGLPCAAVAFIFYLIPSYSIMPSVIRFLIQGFTFSILYIFMQFLFNRSIVKNIFSIFRKKENA